MTRQTSLAQLLRAKAPQVLERWRLRLASSLADGDLSRAELMNQMPLFVNELIARLEDDGSKAAPPEGPEEQESPAAPIHGLQRLRVGFDVDEVIREYAVLGDVVLELCHEEGMAPTAVEGRVLLSTLTAGAADAVAAYARRRDEETKQQTGKHLSFIAHGLRNPLGAAWIALQLAVVRKSKELEGPVAILQRALTQIQAQIDQVLTAQRLDGHLEPVYEDVGIHALIDEIRNDVLPEAEHKRLVLTVEIEPALTIDADPSLLRSALANLVRNAVKFSTQGSAVVVRARTDDEDMFFFEIEDGCSGLPAESTDIFEPYIQRGTDRSGLGLGLSIAKQAIAAHGGVIGVRNGPGTGCVFFVRMPAHRTTAT